MSHAFRTSIIALSALLSIGLAGCDRAEQTAESTAQTAESKAREVGRIAAEEARKALRSTGEAVNRGLGTALDTTRRWLDDADRAAEERAQRREQEHGAPEAPGDKRGSDGKSLSI